MNGCGLEPSGMTVAEFKEPAIEENGLFVLTETTVVVNGVEHEEVRLLRASAERRQLWRSKTVPRG